MPLYKATYRVLMEQLIEAPDAHEASRLAHEQAASVLPLTGMHDGHTAVCQVHSILLQRGTTTPPDVPEDIRQAA